MALFLAAAAPLQQAQRADGVRVVPDHFLRSWDPLTVFFAADTGPAAGGPEDAPQRLVSMQPAIPGAWSWLGPRVLQFRPTEAWQPLRRVTIVTAGHATTLIPLLPVPTETGPADDPSGIADLDRVALTFPGPVDQAALARLLTIELRPQPGISAAGATMLTAQDFTVSAEERPNRAAPQTYLVVLHRPIPDGQVAIVRLRLSDVAGLDSPIFETRLHSPVPFTLTEAVCGQYFDAAYSPTLLRCQPGYGATSGSPRSLNLNFTAPPEALDAVHARDVLRITPHVDGLTVVADGNTLRIRGAFAAATVYTIALPPGALHDTRGRPLAPAASTTFAFDAAAPGLRWDASQGIVERFGPQMVPMRGQGYGRADLRIYPVDPLSRDFWPFPQTGLITADDTPPPLPGKEPTPWDQPLPISPEDMALRLVAAGSPSVSTLVDLPLSPGGLEQKFGLDVAQYLARIAGVGQPGAYLMGMRPVDARDRHWVRVQVTDLSLTAVEEAGAVRFAVTSLATAQPVAGATIELEDMRNDGLETAFRGTTGADGSVTWTVPPYTIGYRTGALTRVIVTKGNDTLVLDPRHGPPQYTANGWGRGGGNWLSWAASGALGGRRPAPRLLCHVFTERPIYRPEEKVMIAGMVRDYDAGTLSYASGGDGVVIVTGPDNQTWKLPAPLDEVGGFHLTFDAKTTATGDYTVQFQPADKWRSACDMSFKKEAYRLPTFEVLLTGATKVSLDKPFSVDLLARWFAGGLVSDRPVSWRVTQFPYVWSPPGREGFEFSSADSTLKRIKYGPAAAANKPV